MLANMLHPIQRPVVCVLHFRFIAAGKVIATTGVGHWQIDHCDTNGCHNDRQHNLSSMMS